MNLLSALPPFDEDNRFRREKGTGNWNRALNDLRYERTRWRYFALKSPPKKNTKKGTLNDAQINVTYKEVQDSIKNLVKMIENGQMSFEWTGGTETLKEFLIRVLTTLKGSAMYYERRLFDEMQYRNAKSNRFTSFDYDDLVKAADGISKKNMIAYNDSIDYWTRAFYDQLALDPKPISQKDAFALIITSDDFYIFLTKNFNKLLSRFQQRGALKASGTQADLDRIKKLTDEIDLHSLENLYNAYDQYLENDFLKENSGADEEMKKELRNAMDEIMTKNYFSQVKSGKRKGKPNFRKALDKDKKQLATSVSKTIRSNLERKLKELSKKATEEAKKNNETAPEINFSIKLGEDNNPWFYVSSEYGPVNMIQEMFNQKGGQKATGQELVKLVINILKECIKNFTVSGNELDLKGVRVPFEGLQVEKIKTLGFDALKEGAINFINTGKIYEFLNGRRQRSNYWKTFELKNNNAFLSGFVGELSANFLTENIDKVKMTGDWFSTLGDTNKKSMQSVNDLIFSYTKHDKKNGNKDYRGGINVKHYTTKDGTFQLYKDQAKFSIYDNALSNKYLGAQDTQLLRFIVENEGYFTKSADSIHNLEVKIVASHFPEFIRAHDYDKHSVKNLFFMINNVIYPTSYIYSCAIAEINSISDPEKINELFAPNVIGGETKNEKEMYNTLSDARNSWEEKDHELRHFTDSNMIGHNLLIQGKGLKMNLVSTTLFH